MNNPVSLFYESLVLMIIWGFAAYDIRTRRVPDRALILFCPVAFLSLPIRVLLEETKLSPLPVFLSSLAGSLAGFLILLGAAMISKSGTGLGGGDIKFTAVIGFVYGLRRMLDILVIATFLAACAVILTVCRHRKQADRGKKIPLPIGALPGEHTMHDDRNKPLSIPFIPFIAVGCLISLAAAIITNNL